jgi:hypothetical protein
MKRIAFALVASLVGFSALAADFQQKPVDFNNGQLGTYPTPVQGYEPPQRMALAPVGPDTAKNSQLAAYPWVPASGGMMNRMAVRQDAQPNYRAAVQADDGELVGG